MAGNPEQKKVRIPKFQISNPGPIRVLVEHEGVRYEISVTLSLPELSVVGKSESGLPVFDLPLGVDYRVWEGWPESWSISKK